MDFKKPNGYEKGRPKITLPERNNKSPVSFRSNQTAPVAPPTPVTPSRSTKKILGIPLVTLPSKKVVTSRARRLLSSKQAVIVAGVIVVISALVIWSVANQQSTAKKATARNSNESVENLEYQTVLPENKSISELGGWKRISPEKSDPVFAFSDKIGDIPVSVSEQPLPASFKTNIDDQIAELAKKFNATTKIDASGTKVYIGTSAKGPQSAILTKNGLLILIKSENKVDEKAWAEYVKSLN